MTFLVSYPGPAWHIRGASNFRSRDRARTSPRQALRDWLGFADLLAARGARLAVLAPPLLDPPLTGMLYAANYGALFWRDDVPRFLVARASVEHRALERHFVRAFFESFGVETAQARATWEGQAEICTLPANRYLLTWGVRSARESVDEVGAWLPGNARVLALRLREPFFHGDTCLDAIAAPGRTILLCHEGALVDARLADVERFCAPDVEVLPVSEADALAYACNALPVGTDLIAPSGLSADLRERLSARGVRVVEIALPELFGKGGGGPRCLVNELRGLDAPVPDAARWRPAIEASLAGYPEAL
jgi:N-dimethylarginine dimethylaminohydrolase